MKKGFFTIVSIMVILSLLFTGCFTAQNNDGTNQTEDQNVTNDRKADRGSKANEEGSKILKMNSHSEPGSLHPALAQGTHESIILDHVFEGLTKRTPEGKIVAGMAKEWKISDDKLTYTFTLRDGIQWSNGDPVTAQDFEYAWKYALNPNTPSDYAWQLYYLKGAEAFNSFEITDENKDKEETKQKLKELEDAVGVKALDGKTLEVQLHQPVPYFLELCAFYTFYPINKKVQEANPEWANDGSTHVSNGPFKIVEWNHKENVKVMKNEYYYNKEAIKLDGINFAMVEDRNTAWQMYRSGELDIEFDLPPDVVAQLNAQNDPEFIIGPELANYFYRFNTTRKPFNNVKVRKALAMAIDRQVLCENVARGGQKPAYGLVPPGVLDETGGQYVDNVGPYFQEDVEKAKQLLAEGLKEEGMDSLRFTLLYNTSEGHKKIAEAIQEMWRKHLGVEVRLENTEFQVKIDREHALDYDVSRAGWIGDYIDPMTFLDMWTSESSQNDTGWTNAEFDQYIAEAKVTFDAKTRMENMRKAEAIFMEAMPVMPIYFYTRPYVQKSYVKGTFKSANRDICAIYADIEK